MILIDEYEVRFGRFPNGETNLNYNTFMITSNSTVTLKYESDLDLFNLMILKRFLDETLERQKLTLRILYMPYSRMDRKNAVYTYQYNTRDTFGFALKSTYIVNNSKEINIFKDPATDDGTKKSQTGRVIVTESGYIDGLTRSHEMQLVEDNLLRPIFENGVLLADMSLAKIRANIK